MIGLLRSRRKVWAFYSVLKPLASMMDASHRCEDLLRRGYLQHFVALFFKDLFVQKPYRAFVLHVQDGAYDRSAIHLGRSARGAQRKTLKLPG